MNPDEAQALLREMLGWQRRRTYDDLRAAVGTVELSRITGEDGAYQIQVCILWEHDVGGIIRVHGTIEADAAGPSAPISESFLVSPGDPSS